MNNDMQIEFENKLGALLVVHRVVRKWLLLLALEEETQESLAAMLADWFNDHWHARMVLSITDVFDSMHMRYPDFHPLNINYMPIAEYIMAWLPDDHPIKVDCMRKLNGDE